MNASWQFFIQQVAAARISFLDILEMEEITLKGTHQEFIPILSPDTMIFVLESKQGTTVSPSSVNNSFIGYLSAFIGPEQVPHHTEWQGVQCPREL
jgi:hypothetical protein